MNRDDFLTTPHSAESEASVLGALLLDNDSMQRLQGLTAEAFYTPFHRQVFDAIQAIATTGMAFDMVTVFEQLREQGKSEADTLSRLGELAQYVPSAANIRRHADIIVERFQSRRLITAATQIIELASKPGKPGEQVNEAQMLLAKLTSVKAKREPQHIHQSLTDYLKLLHDLSEGKNPAIPTGIGGLDELLNGGMRRGEMMVIGARPKHGKTALSLAMARNMAHKYNVLFISQEMPISQLMHRHTAAMGSVDLGRILRADATDTGMWERVGDAAHRLGQLKLVHDEQSAQSLMDVRRKAVKVKREHGLDVLFVDFLQLMQGAGDGDNRNRELDVIANGIKALAMDLECAVVLLSQMSRKADENYGRPAMTHLRDSGAIEAAADQVALLFTDHSHPLSPKLPQFAGYSELEIVAHRNGAQGLIPMELIGKYQQIGDWCREMPNKTDNRPRKGNL